MSTVHLSTSPLNNNFIYFIAMSTVDLSTCSFYLHFDIFSNVGMSTCPLVSAIITFIIIYWSLLSLLCLHVLSSLKSFYSNV
jgi:hypothetical protein